MYDEYSKIIVKTDKQEDYTNIFGKHINVNTAFNTIGGKMVIKDGKWIMAKGTFLYIKKEYDKCKG